MLDIAASCDAKSVSAASAGAAATRVSGARDRGATKAEAVARSVRIAAIDERDPAAIDDGVSGK